MTSQRPDAAAPRVPEVSVREAWGRLTNAQQAAALIDVRETWEYQEGHAKNATSIPLSELQQRASEVPHDREVLLICHSGHRSLTAAKFLQRQGITRVANVTGGTEAWEQAGLPMIWAAH
ncbi:MAG: rhodanese-like domain-containing protein [Ktedonobacterales bacterium]|nr:rhodanese-like domain-containing protein [Ktedonobacterales bacterium]